MQIFNFLKNKIKQHNRVMLLLVVHSKGSSPGRQGFKMGLAMDGEIQGSIGGGIMEYKLVEKAKEYLKTEFKIPILKKQIHRGEIVDGSGMICSGEQTVLFYLLKKSDLGIIHLILSDEEGVLKLNPDKIEFLKSDTNIKNISFEQKSDKDWIYQEKINQKNKLFIIGAGHVGLATSEIISKLDFEITIIDDRENLNTLMNNKYIDNKIITNYENINQFIPDGENTFVAIMTQGFKTDKIVLKKLIQKNLKYIGVLGSKAKIKKMFLALEKEGTSKDLLDKVNAPIGLSIYSQTPMEIALSIAAKVVRIKNEII